MPQKRISHCQREGSIAHNNRDFYPDNVNREVTANNIVFVREPIGDAYHKLFDEAVRRYNARQKRNDRRIKNGYYEHVFHREPKGTQCRSDNKQYNFYEDLIQIGTKDDTHVGTADAEIAVACLTKYMEGFQKRNPNFYVFNAVLHLDEQTPHLHIDWIPVGHYTKGLDTQNGLNRALKEMGYGEDKDAISRWREAERKVLEEICAAHGIDIAPPQQSRGYNFTVAEYKKHQDTIHALEAEQEQAEAALSDTQSELDKAAKKKTKLIEVESIAAKKSILGGKVTITAEDFQTLSDLAAKQVATAKTTKKLKSENAALQEQVETLTAEVEQLCPKQTASLSRKTLQAEAKGMSEKVQLRSALNRALAFIEQAGLSEQFQHFKAYGKKYDLE